jgi:hypothetical protein
MCPETTKKLHSAYGITTDITTIARSLSENNVPYTTPRKTPLRNNHAARGPLFPQKAEFWRRISMA